ncbi:MAG: CoA pyrophosphatase [Chloroflexota bacterium]
MCEKIRQILAGRKKRLLAVGEAVPAAVLIPLFKKDGCLHILFTKRTETVARHKGQISFPGGACNPEDPSLLATALRETFEEVGIREEDVDVLGSLDDIVTSTNFLVSPFVGAIPCPYEFKVCAEEVSELIEVPLRALTDGINVRQEFEIRGGLLFPVHFYHYEGYVIWGVTARLLTQFVELLRRGGFRVGDGAC